MVKGLAKKIKDTYKGARSSVRKASEKPLVRAATLHLDKTAGAAAKSAGMGGAYKAGRGVVQAEFSGNKKIRKQAKADLRKWARGGTTGSGKKAAPAAAEAPAGN